jgi:hypothetical protein
MQIETFSNFKLEDESSYLANFTYALLNDTECDNDTVLLKGLNLTLSYNFLNATDFTSHNFFYHSLNTKFKLPLFRRIWVYTDGSIDFKSATTLNLIGNVGLGIQIIRNLSVLGSIGKEYIFQETKFRPPRNFYSAELKAIPPVGHDPHCD